jgi:hypothetical protein
VHCRNLASYSEILKNKSVEEVGVCIPQVTEVDVFLNGCRFGCQLLETWKLLAKLESDKTSDIYIFVAGGCGFRYLEE